MLWASNLDHGASEVGMGPVGPGAGRELLLLYVGRVFVLGLLKAMFTLMSLPLES